MNNIREKNIINKFCHFSTCTHIYGTIIWVSQKELGE